VEGGYRMMTTETIKARPVVAVVLIAVTFFYFLVFAQFAFLHRMDALGVDDRTMQAALGVMAAGGVVASFATAFALRRVSGRSIILISLAGSATAAFMAAIDGRILFVPLGGMVGMAVGALTVAVASSLSPLLDRTKVGLWTGIGVGVAYGSSNLPFIFNASARMQCLIAGTVALTGLGAAWMLPQNMSAVPRRPQCQERREAFLFGRVGLLLVTLLFVMLVWLDSAAFYVIQEQPAMKAASWSGVNRLEWIGGTHLLAAVVAGLALDRGRLQLLLFWAFAALLGGAVWLHGLTDMGGIGATLLYAVGVSFYSTALVAYGALGAAEPGPAVPTRVGVVFAFGGWIASSLGIGMVVDVGGLPEGFLIVMACIFAILMLVPLGARYRLRIDPLP